jgi:alpha-beta hydrolase superfamily lysophospholipase
VFDFIVKIFDKIKIINIIRNKAMNALQFGSHYQLDVLGTDYEYLEIPMPDDDEGKVISTLIRKKASSTTSKAVLYIHGFVDYFFQTEMAERFNQHGFDFYALDLRKYGRSLLAHQTAYKVHDLREYNADIHAALNIIEQEGHERVLLAGHSTGGLTATLFAAHHPAHPLIQGLWLNSPFYDFNMRPFEKKYLLPRLAQLGKKLPDLQFPSRLNRYYVPSLHQMYHGEWIFNLEWKKPNMPLVPLSFVTAIYEAQKEIHQGVTLNIPSLVMYSHQTTYPLRFNRNAQTSDVILDVRDIIKYVQKIKGDVLRCEIKDALHDVVLSKRDVREKVYQQLFAWLADKNF